VGIGVPFREGFGGDVEAREAAHPATDEIDEHDRVPPATHPGGKGECRGSHAEGDHIGKRVELASKRGILLA
jgi:hypothetical protein